MLWLLYCYYFANAKSDEIVLTTLSISSGRIDMFCVGCVSLAKLIASKTA